MFPNCSIISFVLFICSNLSSTSSLSKVKFNISDIVSLILLPNLLLPNLLLSFNTLDLVLFNDNSADAPLSFDIHKTIEDSKKVKPQDVFEGYKKGKNKKKKEKD